MVEERHLLHDAVDQRACGVRQELRRAEDETALKWLSANIGMTARPQCTQTSPGASSVCRLGGDFARQAQARLLFKRRCPDLAARCRERSMP
jgi:hypothetical protein